jgi:thiol-disulfide isomerase/thioredoxin
MTNFVTKFGSILKSKSGSVATSEALTNKRAIGLYFSAHWCPPCKEFTPILGKKYEALQAAGKDFELIFVSSDRDEATFNSYHASMPFLALPFSERAKKEQLSDQYGVRGIPTLVILDGATGEVINKNARVAISAVNFIDQFPWVPPPRKALYDFTEMDEENANSINSESCLILLLDGLEAGAREPLKAMLNQIATTEFKKNKSDRRVLNFFTGCGGGPEGQIRGGCKLPLTNQAEMIVSNFGDRGAFYKAASAAVTPESIEAFLNGWKASPPQHFSQSM